jgi:selenocysteine-specific elongation factor
VIIATAGHVDHGKTSLIKGLTGVDTDRLEEEKRRGLSINLGYAYLPQEGASPIGFIDVPGHRRFINTMIAGVSGIDLGLLVVAADDGPMPQTLEHLDVLQLLGVKRYALVVSKIDRVESARVAEVQSQLQTLLSQRNITEVPVFPLSNQDGEGVQALADYLQSLSTQQETRVDEGYFRLSIDRSFNLKGSGLVVTGTAAAGKLKIGDKLILMPQQSEMRVRSLHVQDQQAEIARAGQRCAINVVGELDKSDINRGDWLVAAPNPQLSRRIDADFQLLADLAFPLKHLSPVRFHLGAKRVAAKVYLLDDMHEKNQLQAGGTARVQLILDEPVSCVTGERFLLRDDSESFTLGGGRILDPMAPQSGKATQQRLQFLQAMSRSTPELALEDFLSNGQRVELNTFASSWNISAESVQEMMKPGMALLEDASVQWVVPDAEREVEDRKTLQLKKKTSAVQDQAEQRWLKIEELLRGRGFEVPLSSQVVEETGIDARKISSVMGRASGEGRVVEITKTRHALIETMHQLVDIVLQIQAEGEALTVIQFKGRIGTGRKLAIEVLEYFDKIGFTQRNNDVREVVDASIPERILRGASIS